MKTVDYALMTNYYEARLRKATDADAEYLAFNARTLATLVRTYAQLKDAAVLTEMKALADAFKTVKGRRR